MPGENSEQARAFFAALWAQCDDSGSNDTFIELRLIPPGTQLFFKWPNELDGLVNATMAANGQHNVYFGVCPRSRKSGKAEDVATAPAIWADIDFKDIPQDKAFEKLKTFPLRPSIGVMSGNGCHAYWLLKEPEKDDLKRIVSINRAVAKTIKADIHSCDIARILRVPGTLNVKYTPPRECKLVVFHPERVYNLGDFADFLTIEQQTTETADPPSAPAAANVEQGQYEIPNELKNQLGPIIVRMWKTGSRHAAALFMSGMLAKAGITKESVRGLIQSVCFLSGDDEEGDRLRTVEESFTKLKETGSAKLGGAALLEKNVIQELPRDLQESARKALKIVSDSVRMLRGETAADDQPADIKVTKLVKFDSRPALWEVTILTKGKEWTVRGETAITTSFGAFHDAFWEEFTFFPPMITLGRWKKLLEEAPKEIRPVDSDESTPEGYLKHLIEGFEAKAYGEKTAEMGLGVVPIKLDDGSIAMKLETLLRYLGNELGNKVSIRPKALSIIREMGYRNTLKRVGGKAPFRVWVKEPEQQDASESNGRSEGQQERNSTAGTSLESR